MGANVVYFFGPSSELLEETRLKLKDSGIETVEWNEKKAPDNAQCLLLTQIPEWIDQVSPAVPVLIWSLVPIQEEYPHAVMLAPLTKPHEVFNLVTWLTLSKAKSSPEVSGLEATNLLLQEQTIKLRKAMEELEARNQQVMEELDLASELQKSLLPKEFPKDIPFDFAHRYIPYFEVGGDFYDVIRVDEEHIGLMIADVSGHGLASAFLTSMFKSTFLHFGIGNTDPADVLTKVNKEFAATINTEHYLTGFYAIVDINTLECRYCNAGHPKQLVIRTDGSHEELTTAGFFIGMFEHTKYESETIQLQPGDRFLLFTDGVLETIDDEENQFGREGILDIFNKNGEKSIEDISNTIIRDLILYMGSANFDDDITFLLSEVIDSL
jgi:sigma-B regulation protein RsbU (phosphoserine phosphatase)